MHFKLQRANAVCDAFDIIAQAMREVIHWVNAPLVAGLMMFGVPDAINAAGLTGQASAISQAGGPMNFSFIAAGDHQVAEVGLASELLGWRAVDAAARIMAGDGPGRATGPGRLRL